MTDRPRLVTGLTRAPLHAAELAGWLADPAAGATVTFEGSVRSPDRGRRVARLDYEAHDALARRRLRQLAAEVAEHHGLVAAAAVHRLGPLAPGTTSLAVVCCAPHRAAAQLALSELLERVKAEVPVWKREVLHDGTARWIGLPEASQPSGADPADPGAPRTAGPAGVVDRRDTSGAADPRPPVARDLRPPRSGRPPRARGGRPADTYSRSQRSAAP